MPADNKQDEQSEIIAVTGATGFIGGALVRHLSSKGKKLRVLVRQSSHTQSLSSLGAQIVVGDINDSVSLNRLVRGARGVIHCAGAVRGSSDEDFRVVNVDGISNLVRICAQQNPLPRFLLLSSLAAGEPQLSPYAHSKREGEKVLASESGFMKWTVLRPPAVYGAKDRELLPLFRLMSRGLALVLGPKDARISLLYIEDLVAAIAKWLNTDMNKNAVFEIHDGKANGYSWDEIVAITSDVCKKRIFKLRVSKSMLRIIAISSISIAKLLNYKPMLTPKKVNELTHFDWVCDNTNLQAEIDWQPQFLFSEGLRCTLYPKT